MKRKQFLLLIVIATPGLSCGQLSGSRTDPPDFRAYVAEVRKLGMTESAKGSLNVVASIRTGGMLLTFAKDEVTGSYDRSYQSTACPVPGTDPEILRRWQAEVQKRVDDDLDILRKHADRDASGFVSTVEGQEFLDLVEFGYLAAHIVEAEGASGEILARAASLSIDQADARVARYNALVKQLNASSEFKSPLIDLTSTTHGTSDSRPGA